MEIQLSSVNYLSFLLATNRLRNIYIY